MLIISTYFVQMNDVAPVLSTRHHAPTIHPNPLEAMSTTTKTDITILAGNSIFTVPDRVALEQGFFDEEGLNVKAVQKWEDRNHKIKDPIKDPLAQFESGVHDTFNMCEWGVLRRLEHTERAAHIAYLRPAVVAQALLSFDPPY